MVIVNKWTLSLNEMQHTLIWDDEKRIIRLVEIALKCYKVNEST